MTIPVILFIIFNIVLPISFYHLNYFIKIFYYIIKLFIIIIINRTYTFIYLFSSIIAIIFYYCAIYFLSFLLLAANIFI